MLGRIVHHAPVSEGVNEKPGLQRKECIQEAHATRRGFIACHGSAQLV